MIGTVSPNRRRLHMPATTTTKQATTTKAKPARKRAGGRGSKPVGIQLTRALGIVGWSRIDPVVLAALALEAPVLLVGAHGTAKSLVVERVAKALGFEFRHYNASLLNYDDLVGIPLPVEGSDQLRFVGTDGSIWDAEFVFVDELSRCRADLQNKVFPIVHERRVAGLDLDRLRHRWAAMNPPAPDDPDDPSADGDVYLGAEPIDPALADRFPFVVRVPGWDDLTKDERLALAAGMVPLPGALDLPALVERCASLAAELAPEIEQRAAEYVVAVTAELRGAALALSPRRVRMLARSVAALHAARQVLERGTDLEDSAELVLEFGLPQTAGEEVPSPIKLRAAHRQAWEISGLAHDAAWRQVLEERDPVARVLLGDRLELADRDLSRLVTQALGAQQTDADRVALGTAMFLSFRERRNLTPAAWEPLVQLARRVLEPREVSASLHMGSSGLETWRTMTLFVANPARTRVLERNFLLGGFPDLFAQTGWHEAHRTFVGLLNRFGVAEGTA